MAFCPDCDKARCARAGVGDGGVAALALGGARRCVNAGEALGGGFGETELA